MKKLLASIIAVLLVGMLVGCELQKGSEEKTNASVTGKENVKKEEEIANETEKQKESVVESKESVEETVLEQEEQTSDSPYMAGVAKVYAKDSEYNFYDMLFRDNKLVYVDLEDGNGLFKDIFGEICKGTFGENAPNPIEDISLSSFTVERAIEFFEEKGFTVTVTQE